MSEMGEIKAMCKRFEPVGSRITCDPVPMDTDEDFLVLIGEVEFNALYQLLMVEGFELGGSVPMNEKRLDVDDCFCSFTLGQTNLIVTASDVFFDRFMTATAEAKRLNLLDKADRIALFQSILYKNEIMEPL